jgi:uncharacterized protein involved in outer membrane biogenesis
MKRLLALPAILLVFAIFALFGAPYLIPQSTLQKWIAPSLERQAGITLQTVKRVKLTFSPQFGMAVEGVKAVLRKRGRDEQHIEASRIVASVKPSSLMEGRVELEKIRLESPVLTLRNGLMTLSNGAAPSSVQAYLIPAKLEMSGDGLDLPLIDVDVVDGAVDFQNRDGKTLAMIERATLALRHQVEREGVTLNGDFDLEGQKFRLAASAEPTEVESDSSIDVNADLNSSAIGAQLAGILSPDAPQKFSGQIELKIASGEELSRWIGSDPLALKRFTGANIRGQLDISDAFAALSKARLTAASMEGDLSVFAEYGRKVEAQLTNGAIFDGQAEGALALSRGRSKMQMAASFRMNGVDSLALGEGMPGLDWLSGRANTSLEVSADGENWSEILGALKGNAQFAVSDGAIEGIDLPLIVAEARAGEFKKWQRRPGLETPFDLMEASFKIEKGVARTDDLRLSGPRISVTGQGTTNLARQRLKYALQTRITAGGEGAANAEAEKEAQFSLPIIVKGRWDRPDIYPDLARAFKDPDSISGTAELVGRSVEELTDGEVKADDLGKILNGLFGKKKKKKNAVEPE